MVWIDGTKSISILKVKCCAVDYFVISAQLAQVVCGFSFELEKDVIGSPQTVHISHILQRSLETHLLWRKFAYIAFFSFNRLKAEQQTRQSLIRLLSELLLSQSERKQKSKSRSTIVANNVVFRL